MFGKLGDMAGMLKQARELQEKMAAVKEELTQLEVKGQSQCGNVEIVMTCDMTARSVSVKQECMDTGDTEIMQQLILEAVNSAVVAAKNKAAEKMNALTGGMDIPGL